MTGPGRAARTGIAGVGWSTAGRMLRSSRMRSASSDSRSPADRVAALGGRPGAAGQVGGHEVVRQMITEAFRNGVWGIVDDMLCITKPWALTSARFAFRPGSCPD